MSRHSERGRRQRHTGKQVYLHVCCNDPDNGLFADHVHAMQFERMGNTIDFELSGGAAPRFAELTDQSAFRIFRMIVPYDRSAYGVGNWCWNSYRITIPRAARIIAHPLHRKLFSVDGCKGGMAISLSNLLDAGAPASLVEGVLVKFGTVP